MRLDLEAIRARVGKATAGPWSACCAHNLKGCSHVMHEDGMIADVTKGKWGDDYPSLRFVDGSIDRKVEAYMEQITYGEVSDEQSNANKVFIAHARADIPALLARVDELERVAEALEDLTRRCDGPEGIMMDGSNIDTAQSAAALFAAGMEK